MGQRNKILDEAIPDCYEFSKQAFEGKITANDAALLIHEKYDITLNSAISYPYCFKVLITGIGSCSSISSYALDSFFERIEIEYDKQQLKKSLNTFMRLIENYEGEKVGLKKSFRAIHDKYSKLL